MLQNQNRPRTLRSESSAVTGAKRRRAVHGALVLTLLLLLFLAVAISASAEDFEPAPPTTAAGLTEGVREGGSPEHSIELTDIQPANGPSFEVQSYEEDFGVSAQTAEQNLAVQQRAIGVVEGLEHALGKDYAGVWFDHEKGEFVVPIAADSSQVLVKTILSDTNLEGHFRTASARYTWAELESAQEQLNKSLMPLMADGLVQTYLNARTNAVILREASSASAADESQLKQLAASQNGKVEVKQRPVGRFNVDLMCKTTAPRGCNPPLRGGVAMSPPGEIYPGSCSAAFKAVDSAGNRYVLTAGHCATGSSSWEAEDGSGKFHMIGSVAQYHFPGGDWAKLNANGSYWDTNPWPSMVAHYWEDQERLINSESRSYLGEYVCHSGGSSGTSCGNVVALDVTESIKGGQYVYHAVEFGEVCIVSGDSGGPVFKGNTALGIFNAGEPTGGSESNCLNNSVGYGQYLEITEATDDLGVSVGPRGEAPIASTSGASAVQSYQATGNGNVDPNGAATSYHFEYGTTASYGKSTPSWSAGSGWSPATVSGAISGLEPATTYHYRIVASNSFGTSYGSDQLFTTPNAMRPAVVVDSSGTTHVYYRAQNNQLQEYYQYGSLWKHREWGYANTVGGNPSAVLGSDGKIWVYFRTPNGQLGSWWFKGSEWNYQAWGVENTTAGDPSAFQASDGKRWVYFKTPNGQLGSWWFKGSEWNYQAWGVENKTAGDTTAFEDSSGKRWVYFKTPNGQLGSWWFKGSEWNYQAWGVENTTAGDPSAFQASDGKRWVYFRTPNGQLGSWWFKGSEWNYQPWGVGNTTTGDTTAFEDSSGKRWVYFRTPNGQLGSWWFKGSEWNYQPWGYEKTLGGDPSGIVASGDKRELFFIDPQGNPYRWWFKGSEWNPEIISSSPVNFVPRPAVVVDSAGVTHVYYRAQNNQLQEYYQYGSLWKHREWGYANTVGGNPSAVLGSDGKIWVYFRTPNGQLGSWWFKGSEWNYQAWGVENTTAGDPSAFQASDGKRWVYFKTPNGQLGSWWFKGSEWNYQAWGVENTTTGDTTAFEDSSGKRWVYFRTPNGQLGSWWFKGSEWNYQPWGYAGLLGGDPSAVSAPSNKRELFYFDPQAFAFRWWWFGSEWNLEGLIF